MLIKLNLVPTGLSELSNVVKNEVVKKTEYDELVKLLKLMLFRLLILVI